MGTNTKHKDRLFRFIFGNPDHKEWTLSLYNALNGSHYDDPDAIVFNTIEDAVRFLRRYFCAFTTGRIISRKKEFCG
ncbi:MAG: hypothetical protein IJQ58_01010 [Synergistaceae bacterium]|nr:hypothetical protein [Synergistaceae bacterium]